MKNPDVFVSVGGTSNEQQENFVRAVEDRLRSEGLEPHTVGRNTFSSDAPLKTVTDLMAQCAGSVVIALERSYFPKGMEKRDGPKQSELLDIRLPTPWCQIEAAMAYSRGMPLLIIVEENLRSEGLLERGYDWYVQWVKPTPSALTSTEFNGVLASWKDKVRSKTQNSAVSKSPAEMTIGDLVSGLKPAQLWSLLAAMAAIAAGAFALGAKLLG